MNDNEKAVSVVILALLGIPAMIFFSSLLNGWALSVLWRWFVSPVFEIRNLGIAEAIGLSLIVSYLTHQAQNKNREENSLANTLGLVIVRPLFSVLIGWCIKFFI